MLFDGEQGGESFGANEWLYEEFLSQYREDRNAVPRRWRDYFDARLFGSETASRVPAQTDGYGAQPAAARALIPDYPGVAPWEDPLGASEVSDDGDSGSPAQGYGEAPGAGGVQMSPAPAALVSEPTSEYTAGREVASPGAASEEQTTVLRGFSAAVAKNMSRSLEIPTATSVRDIPSKLLEENRAVINTHLARSSGGKVSFTHLIAYALVESCVEMPEMTYSYRVTKGKPERHFPGVVNLGIAIDIPVASGERQLMVPSVKSAQSMNFAEFVAAYEALVKKAREGKLTTSDHRGATLTLTNPGGIGTVHSIPRLMEGQAAIIGVGSLSYPSEYEGTSPQFMAKNGISKRLTLTSTYDHRVIQGASSGEFLRRMHDKLIGLDGFYERIFQSLRIPYEPLIWRRDIDYDPKTQRDKPTRIAELIYSYRSRGHLMADIDPLYFRKRRHAELELDNHGLTVWDLDRYFPTGGFSTEGRLRLTEILDRLREAYCRTTGIEYMHIQDSAQRKWFQERLEKPYEKLPSQTQARILRWLNEAEAFETFLQTKYVGQKRFSLEGGESLLPLLHTVLRGASRAGTDEVVIGMAHRGRLNVLTNIAGKSFSQVFSEFEDNEAARNLHHSGDVKYHLGTVGTYRGVEGASTRVYLAANPSHLEAVNGVVEGVVRAKQDRIGLGERGYTVLPILVHGDAAFAGQGVVYETLNLCQLPGYRTGGTIHVVINNQIGFTTSPVNSRSTRYPTDMAKGLQVPIFHVNGDDPEAVCRAAKMAHDYRERFHHDVIIDMVCYRRRGHNEGDDPSMTQPVMYSLIDTKRSVRQRYAESLLGRGDITSEEAQAAAEAFRSELEGALHETRGSITGENGAGEDGEGEAGNTVGGLEQSESQWEDAGVMVGWKSAVPAEMIARIGEVHANIPRDFTPHSKLGALLDKRLQMSQNGRIDWGFGELIAIGSLLMEGTPVRLAGQDSRRGTFVQRHATIHDQRGGREWTPLNYLTDSQAAFSVIDSPLSEYATLGFEYGYSIERPDALVLWEAQFGDFANGAQTVIDEFVSSAQHKWSQSSSLVMLLPHGYEGQGPDHSSGRIERFLQLCAYQNMVVAQPSTPANYAHLLRRQAYHRPRKPLIVFTPKQLLRRREATSALAEFTGGRYQPVIGDAGASPRNVRRVLLCSGRLYYDLAAKRRALKDKTTAIIRLEQLYPLPEAQLRAALARYPGAQLVWVQDEPENQGPWMHVNYWMSSQLGVAPRLVSRSAGSAPATGSHTVHDLENTDLLERAFSVG